MPLDFPSSPSVNDTYTLSGKTWKWNGEGWALVTNPDGSITTAMLADDAVTYAKIQNVSATDRLLGRSSAGAGDVQEITCTSAGRALLDDADATAQRATLGLGTLATQSGTFSGTSSGTNTGDQTITLTGDVTGSGTGSFAATLASVGTAGTYRSVTTDVKGRVTAGTNPTTFSGYAISDTSANLAAAITDETGTGALVFASSPALAGTPTAPTASAGTNTTQIATTAFATTAANAVIPSGTVMLFVQTAAPTGWTKSTTHNDKTLRVVSGTASSGGSTAFTTVFASRTPAGTVGATTLTTSQIPSHAHEALEAARSGGFYATFTRTSTNVITASTTTSASGNSGVGNTGGGGSHDHSFSGTAMDFAVQYVDVIIASKN